MAIYDTDPNTTNRADPLPQVPDEHAVRTADGTTAITNKLNNSTGAYVSTKDALVKVNDGTIDVIKLGLQSDGTFAFQFSDSITPRLLMSSGSIKISKSNFDVRTATNDQLIFNSSQNVFKIVGSGTLTIPAMTLGAAVQTNTYTTTTTSATNTHWLGYIPAVIAYVQNSSGQYETFPYSINSAGGPGGGIYSVYSGISVTATQIFAYAGIVAYGAYVFTGAGEISRPLKYFLLQETAN